MTTSRVLPNPYRTSKVAPNANQVSVFDPGTLSLTGWWRANFTGSPWTPTASVGLSGSNGNLSEATNPPAVGSPVGGFTPANCDGVNDQLLTSNSSQTFFNNNSMSGSVLFYARTAAAESPGTPYFEEAISAGKDYADWGLSFTTLGVKFWKLKSGAGSYIENLVSCGTGAWHLAQFKYDGTNSKLRIDSGAWNIVSGSFDVFGSTVIRVGAGHNLSGFLDGNVMEVMFSDVVLSDADFDNIKSYTNTRYTLGL